MRACGWKRIASDAHANQLLRRELKHHAKWLQRDAKMVYGHYQFSHLLSIKKGNWYQIVKNKRNRYYGLLIWIEPQGGSK